MEEELTNVHNLYIKNRNNINITGITKIISFDDEEFIIDTVYGRVEIVGSDLEIIKLDTVEGNITIKGLINSLKYLDNTTSKENGMLSRLFK